MKYENFLKSGPYITWQHADKMFYNSNNLLHRENDLPAIIWNNNDKEWRSEGKRHRENGPACEYANGTRKWYDKGKSARIDGPAVEWDNGDTEWYNAEGRRVKVEKKGHPNPSSPPNLPIE